MQAGAQVWIRSAAGVAFPVVLGQLRREHFVGSVPWRRFRSRQGQAHLSGSYWAATTGGHLVYESRLELARLLLADFDADVVDIYAQPCRLVARVGGRQRRHVPDFLLVATCGVVTVVNVKPAHRLTDPRVAEALDWPRELFTGHGWRYEIWSGCDAVVLDNVRFLAGYRRREIVTDEAVDRAYHYHRARRNARVRRKREKAHARLRFFFTFAVLAGLALFLVLTIWHEVQKVFGL